MKAEHLIRDTGFRPVRAVSARAESPGHKWWSIYFLLSLLAPQVVIAQTTQAPLPANQIARTELARRNETAIRRGVKFLLSRQSSDGSWPGDGLVNEYIPGRTALVTLALLYCGESHTSPALTRAINYLKKAQPQGTLQATYCIALRACVYASLPEEMRRQELRADLAWLQRALINRSPNRGLYDYRDGPDRGGDFSNSQYGVLGVWYAAQAGIEVPRNYWKMVEDGCRAGQKPDGGWPYQPGRATSTGSMTAAGLATLFITNDYLHNEESQDLSKTYVNKPLEDALQWLGANFAATYNPGEDKRLGAPAGADRDVLNLIGNMGQRQGTNVHYMLFGYERVGEASGLTRFGTHKWFDEGVNFLIPAQQYDGSWSGTNDSEVTTAYALLFLSRGRAPVVAQKLQFDGRWNNRPRDVAAFTLFSRRATERHVNWQIVSIDASPDEFRQAPILYLASDRATGFTSQQKARFKSYIEQGGLLVCVNEGLGHEFANDVLKLGAELFPSYKFRDLPRDHMAYTANFPVPAGQTLCGMSNGVRELIVLYPDGDMTWKWQSTGGGFIARNSPYASLANLWLYMTDRANPHFKGEDPWVERNDGVQTTKKASIVRIRYDGNWDPEPGGWVRLANMMHNFDQLDLDVQPNAEPGSQTLAHLTGTDAIKISTTSKESIRRYIDAGGMLLIDAAGGSTEAVASIESLLRELYPTSVLNPLPLDHPIYHAQAIGGTDINNDINYRRAANLQTTHIPRLRGATVNGKLIAIVSNEDLSGALVGYNIADVRGYTPTSASDLVRNIILCRIQFTESGKPMPVNNSPSKGMP